MLNTTFHMLLLKQSSESLVLLELILIWLMALLMGTRSWRTQRNKEWVFNEVDQTLGRRAR